MSGNGTAIKNEVTAGYLIQGNRICLALKQEKVGEGLWMPYGGAVEPGESYEECMVRELKEESHVHCTTEDLEKVGILSIYKYDKDNRLFNKMSVAVYLIHDWIGDPHDTDEMKNAQWFYKDKLPTEKMLPADRIWLPRVLAGKNVMVKAFYDDHYRMNPKHPPIIEEYVRPSRIP